jgi:hypothetical protein
MPDIRQFFFAMNRINTLLACRIEVRLPTDDGLAVLNIDLEGTALILVLT